MYTLRKMAYKTRLINETRVTLLIRKWGASYNQGFPEKNMNFLRSENAHNMHISQRRSFKFIQMSKCIMP